ncbi:hypothetical protein MesoLj131c_47220 [Mesorhizobium sp. 131-3-5]|uniref:hypothetical protein n=1 Tax=Mesorhizobium sp. 131-3-5 TaxID=2744520 RepID=UPI0019263F91|nr:hypothetical protein [Mesorhizobium sp. 131-3-5]BCH10464.1 hypothetical protein MesoLj131c_47220 [Mesorhizobium sp. 131-3-5]
MKAQSVDWKEMGRSLQQHWLQVFREFQESAESQVLEQEKMVARDLPFHWAVIQMSRGNPGLMIAYLRSGNEINAEHREVLALCLEGKLRDRVKRGRKPSASTEAAEIANRFYRDWKRMNRLNKVADRGHSDDMKAESGRFVVEDYLPHLGAKLHTTLESMGLD